LSSIETPQSDRARSTRHARRPSMPLATGRQYWPTAGDVERLRRADGQSSGSRIPPITTLATPGRCLFADLERDSARGVGAFDREEGIRQCVISAAAILTHRATPWRGCPLLSEPLSYGFDCARMGRMARSSVGKVPAKTARARVERALRLHTTCSEGQCAAEPDAQTGAMHARISANQKAAPDHRRADAALRCQDRRIVCPSNHRKGGTNRGRPYPDPQQPWFARSGSSASTSALDALQYACPSARTRTRLDPA